MLEITICISGYFSFIFFTINFMYSLFNFSKSSPDLPSGFRNSNLRIKLQGILVCAHSISSVEELLIKNMNYIKNLFVTITEIMYLDRAHQQNHKFDFTAI